MRRAYMGFGWGLVVLGAAHMATTFRVFDGLSDEAVWFFGAGMAMALAGALNLLNATYGGRAVGLRRTCVGANLGLLGYAVAAGVGTGATAGQFAVILGLVGGAALLSMTGGSTPPRD